MVPIHSVKSITPPNFPSAKLECTNTDKIFLLCTRTGGAQNVIDIF